MISTNTLDKDLYNKHGGEVVDTPVGYVSLSSIPQEGSDLCYFYDSDPVTSLFYDGCLDHKLGFHTDLKSIMHVHYKNQSQEERPLVTALVSRENLKNLWRDFCDSEIDNNLFLDDEESLDFFVKNRRNCLMVKYNADAVFRFPGFELPHSILDLSEINNLQMKKLLSFL